jgi:hypothetical protein
LGRLSLIIWLCLIFPVTIGIALFIPPMYIAHLVPAKLRGSFVAVNMLAITSDIVHSAIKIVEVIIEA